jgi:high-affinity iron transporter
VRLLLLFAVAAAALLAPAVARADDAQFAEARAQVETARQLTQQAYDAAKAGDRERGYQLARTAYLDHFEHAEVPLRLRDPNLVLDVEFAFAEFRNGIRDGESIGELRETKDEILAGLRDTDRTLADKGIAAPLLAFLFSFGILFREGLEAVLVIAILLGSLASGRATGYRRPLGLGILAALGATLLVWLLTTLVLDLAPVQRELLEGVTAVLAVVVLFLVSFWLVSQLEQKRRLEFMRARVASAIAAGSALAFAGLGFTAVFREGFETVLFYQALAIFAEGLELWVVLGAVTAAVALGLAAYAVIGLGKKLPFKQLLFAGASTLLLLSVAFAGNAVRSLQEAGWVQVTPIQGEWARLQVFLAELTGIHPTREGILVQVALLSVYVAGAVYLFGWKRLGRQRPEAARA